MKRLITVCCAVLMSMAMMAQEGSMFVGGNLNYGMYSNRNEFGLGAKFQYEFIDQWRGEASANYYFEQNDITSWDFSANLHYIFPLDGGFRVYPLAGVCFDYVHANVQYLDIERQIRQYTRTTTRLGLNLGGGVEYPLTDDFKINAELKYQIIQGYSRPVISVGVSYAI